MSYIIKSVGILDGLINLTWEISRVGDKLKSSKNPDIR